VNNTVTASGKFNDGALTSASANASATVYGHVCRITIVKDAQPNDLHDFPFNFSGGGQNVNFLLDDDSSVPGIGDGGDVNQPNSRIFDGLTPGVTYTTTETPQVYFALQAPIVCTGPSGGVAQVANGVSVTVQLDTDAVCTFVNVKTALTRTQGFWKTHTTFTSMVFNAAPLNGNMTIGSFSSGKYVTINSTAKLFGIWCADNAWTTNPRVKRSNTDQLDQFRIQLAKQLVAAKLNVAFFGADSGVLTMIANADLAYSGTNKTAITNAISAVDAYNNSGDTGSISPRPGSATPDQTCIIGSAQLWNNPSPSW
jgi:hypothetical protein